MSGCKGCKVCAKIDDGIGIHYGGQSCSACAAFFIRFPNAKHRYVCENDNMCLAIPSGKGTKCQKCRLNKCFEIGMRSPFFSSSDVLETEINFEYLFQAKRLNALLTVLSTNPKLLYNYYAFDDPKLFHESKAIVEDNNKANIQPPDYVRKWAKVFQNNQIPIPQIHVLFKFIATAIKFPWLSPQDQQVMKDVQQKAFNQFILQYPYQSQAIKEFFETLTLYFQNQFAKYFVNSKLQSNVTIF